MPPTRRSRTAARSSGIEAPDQALDRRERAFLRTYYASGVTLEELMECYDVNRRTVVAVVENSYSLDLIGDDSIYCRMSIAQAQRHQAATAPRRQQLSEPLWAILVGSRPSLSHLRQPFVKAGILDVDGLNDALDAFDMYRPETGLWGRLIRRGYISEEEICILMYRTCDT